MWNLNCIIPIRDNSMNNLEALDSYIIPQDSVIYDLHFKESDSSDWKGFNWEMKVRVELLTIPNIQFQGNPTDWKEWKSKQGNNGIGYDGIVTLPNGEIRTIEMKYRKEGCKVFHSWFIDDWEPRKADIYITNNVEAISYQDKRLLDKNHSKLLSIEDAQVYISQLIHKILHPNQQSSWNSYITDITSKVCSRISCFFNKLSNLKVKRKLKSAKCEAKSSIKHGNPESNIETQKVGDGDLAFNGSEFADDKISSLWSELESSSKLPKIKAYRLTKEEFQKVIDSYFTSKAKMDGYSDSQIAEAVKSGGISIQFPSEYCILIIEATPEQEQRVLTREVSRIAWKDWESFAGDKWKGYTS